MFGFLWGWVLHPSNCWQIFILEKSYPSVQLLAKTSQQNSRFSSNMNHDGLGYTGSILNILSQTLIVMWYYRASLSNLIERPTIVEIDLLHFLKVYIKLWKSLEISFFFHLKWKEKRNSTSQSKFKNIISSNVINYYW